MNFQFHNLGFQFMNQNHEKKNILEKWVDHIPNDYTGKTHQELPQIELSIF